MDITNHCPLCEQYAKELARMTDLAKRQHEMIHKLHARSAWCGALDPSPEVAGLEDQAVALMQAARAAGLGGDA